MKKLLGKCLLACALAVSISTLDAASTNSISPPAHSWPAADRAAVDHWRSLRFGMFIHWGPVSLTGHEIGWSRGAQTPVEIYDNIY